MSHKLTLVLKQKNVSFLNTNGLAYVMYVLIVVQATDVSEYLTFTLMFFITIV